LWGVVQAGDDFFGVFDARAFFVGACLDDVAVEVVGGVPHFFDKRFIDLYCVEVVSFGPSSHELSGYARLRDPDSRLLKLPSTAVRLRLTPHFRSEVAMIICVLINFLINSDLDSWRNPMQTSDYVAISFDILFKLSTGSADELSYF